jgi:hypothetical protein
MTMIDDDTLAGLLAQAADAIDPPEGGAARILERALATPTADEKGETAAPVTDLARVRAQRLGAMARAHRVLSVAAVLVLTLAIAGGASWLGHSPRNDGHPLAGTAALGAAPPQTASVPSTTVPGFASAGGTGGTTGGSSVNGPLPDSTVTGSSAAAPVASGATAPTQAATTPLGTTTAPAASAAVPGLNQSSRIEQTGSLSLTVGKDTLAKTMSELAFLADAANGFVASSQTDSGALAASGTASGSITLQVPEASFGTVVKKAQSLGTTEALSTKATDVTSQFVDLAARIAALQASRQQYLTIMAKATSIGDVLAVQAQLDSIESEIEQLQGQLNVLSNQTTYSTLTVLVSERGARTHHHHHKVPGHRSGLAVAWDNSVHGFVSGVEGLVRLAGPALFVLLCGLIVVLGGRSGWRRYRRRGL